MTYRSKSPHNALDGLKRLSCVVLRLLREAARGTKPSVRGSVHSTSVIRTTTAVHSVAAWNRKGLNIVEIGKQSEYYVGLGLHSSEVKKPWNNLECRELNILLVLTEKQAMKRSCYGRRLQVVDHPWPSLSSMVFNRSRGNFRRFLVWFI